MINYIILAGALLAVFAAIQLGQHIYMMKLADDDKKTELKRMAFWGIVISSTMVAIGLILIGISVFTHLQVQKATKTRTGANPAMLSKNPRNPQRKIGKTRLVWQH